MFTLAIAQFENQGLILSAYFTLTKIRNYNFFGFFQKAIEEKRPACSFADLLDVSYCFALFAAC